MTESTSLAALLRAEQRARWQLGDRVRVEAYLTRHPEVGADPEGLLDLVYNEVFLREEAGEAPSLEEYVERFPALGDQLRLIFEVHIALRPGRVVVPDTVPPSLPPDSPAVPLCVEVSGYEVLSELGRGGMGVVYKARQLSLGRVVALKMLLAGEHASGVGLARFKAEASAVAGLQHPNLVQVYEVGEHDGCPFFSMEFVAGRTLGERINGNPLPADEAARTTAVLARAMHFAHQRGVVHRDLKPANVLLAADGSPKIADFGLAKRQGAQSHTRTGDVLGTPSYMAPEQVAGKGKDAGPAADIYALGALLYEMLTGRPPFKGESAADTLFQVLHADPVPPSLLRAKSPRDLETICLKCLEKDPRKRYASAQALAEDLERFLEGRPIVARPISLAGRVLKWARRRPALASLTAVSVTAVLALTSFLVWHSASEQRRQARERREALSVLARGREAFRRQDWAGAESYAESVLARVRAEPVLNDLHEEAADLKFEAAGRGAARAEAEWVARIEAEFLRLLDEAVFHGLSALAGRPLPTGLDGGAHRRAAEDACRKALALVSLTPGSADPWALSSRFRDPQRRQQITTGCYVLLLVLAEAVAGPTRPLADAPARCKAALRLVEQGGRVRPPTRSWHLRRAYYFARLGDETAARRECSQAESVPLEGALDYFLQGERLVERGDLAGAVRAFESAAALDVRHFWAQCALGVCYLRLSQWDRARACLTVCLVQRPGFVWGHLLRGYAHTELRAWVAAANDFREAERLLGERPPSGARYSLHVNRGGLRLRQGKLEEAAEDFRTAIRLRPDIYVSHVNLARVCQKQNDPAGAERQLRQAHRLNPPPLVLADYHTGRAAVLCERRQYQEAVAACRAALGYQPDHARAQGVLGQALLALGRWEEAIRAFDGYLARGGEAVADVYRGRGAARMKRGDFLGARDDYTRALEIQPGAETHAHRGWAYFFLDAWRPAWHDFDAAVRLDRAGADAYVGRGLAAVMLGRYREAAADAAEALARRLKSPEMMHNLACVFAQAVARVRADACARDRDSLTTRYHERALEAIRQTLALVPDGERPAFWKTKIAPDSALDPVRDSAEFRQLLKQYGRPPVR
jgi:tetratricopeptide (TPR) repeat protein